MSNHTALSNQASWKVHFLPRATLLRTPPAAHQQGLIPDYTRKRRPVQFVFADEFPTRIDALERERQIKKWTRAKKQALIARDWPRLQQLARRTSAKD